MRENVRKTYPRLTINHRASSTLTERLKHFIGNLTLRNRFGCYIIELKKHLIPLSFILSI